MAVTGRPYSFVNVNCVPTFPSIHFDIQPLTPYKIISHPPPILTTSNSSPSTPAVGVRLAFGNGNSMAEAHLSVELGNFGCGGHVPSDRHPFRIYYGSKTCGQLKGYVYRLRHWDQLPYSLSKENRGQRPRLRLRDSSFKKTLMKNSDSINRRSPHLLGTARPRMLLGWASKGGPRRFL